MVHVVGTYDTYVPVDLLEEEYGRYIVLLHVLHVPAPTASRYSRGLVHVCIGILFLLICNI
jgi:hypothetical protein